MKTERKSGYSLFRVWDLVIFVLLLAGIGVALYFAFAPTQAGALAEVYVNGEKRAEFLLSVDRELRLDHLKVVVQGGSLWVEEADCPDKICEKTGKIRKAGQTIVCLPNRVVIRIKGKGDVEAIT